METDGNNGKLVFMVYFWKLDRWNGMSVDSRWYRCTHPPLPMRAARQDDVCIGGREGGEALPLLVLGCSLVTLWDGNGWKQWQISFHGYIFWLGTFSLQNL